VNRFAHKHARNKAGKPQIMPARAKRKRTWMAVSSGKTQDNLACLRGPVNGGAEKMNDDDPHALIRFFSVQMLFPG